ncbi:hypothetical protein COHA_009017 [Chlorella ohadii]|uniref:Uncharacterized protein n=1 Tax=Chlorella ohadii TaxID=2649997 RepID=A0AAD5H1X7_9CHLO|nr:hypothetical protein COHA_009017 [Chlorella ohadii]
MAGLPADFMQGLEHIQLPPGSRILIHGGSGAVGSVAIQFAKRVKRWYVTATCSPANAAYCRKLGADAVHDWRDAAALPKLYSRQPFDVVFDVVGGRTTRDSLAYLKRRGHLVHVLISEANAADLLWMYLKGLLGLGPRLSMISVHPNGRGLGAIARLLSAGTLRPPRISATFPLERASEAHAFLEGSRGPRPPGKVVLQVAHPVLASKAAS